MINYFKYQINLYNELYKCIRMSGRYCGFENLAALQGFPSLCIAFFVVWKCVMEQWKEEEEEEKHNSII